jgi:hypothetical protein
MAWPPPPHPFPSSFRPTSTKKERADRGGAVGNGRRRRRRAGGAGQVGVGWFLVAAINGWGGRGVGGGGGGICR